MKWTISDLVALLAVIANILQAISMFKKNQSDALLNQQLAAEREKDSERRFKIESDKLKLEKEAKESQLQSELDKLKLQNDQKKVESLLPRSQEVFEQYIVETRKVIRNITDLPIPLTDKYHELESLACLYCPEIYQNVLNIDNQNRDYEHADVFYLASYSNEQSYEIAMKQGIIHNLKEIINKINNHMMQRS